jgi:hypothetical protein
VVGVIVAPGLARDVTAGVADDLATDLCRSYPDVDWRTELSVDRLVVPPAPPAEILDAARRELLERNWGLAVVVTDLTLRAGRRPVHGRVGATHGIAIVSLPALGPVQLRRRLHRALLELVGLLVGGDEHGTRLGRLRRGWRSYALRELATDVADRPAGRGHVFLPAVVLGNLRLLLGMVRANRPWRLAARLYSALVAALAVGAYGVVNEDIWRLSASLGWARLFTLGAISIAATVVAIVVVHGLWERVPDSRVREQVILFNVATAATVAIGILALYLALLAVFLAGSALVIGRSLLAGAIGHPAGLGDYAVLAWFLASLATIAGALGASLESDEAVREAAYASAPDGGSDVTSTDADGTAEP